MNKNHLGNNAPKAVAFNGTTYRSMLAAEKSTGVSRFKIAVLASNNEGGWSFLKQEEIPRKEVKKGIKGKPQAVSCNGVYFPSIARAAHMTGNPVYRIKTWVEENSDGWATATMPMVIKERKETPLAIWLKEENERRRLAKESLSNITKEIDILEINRSPENLEVVHYLNKDRNNWFKEMFEGERLHPMQKPMIDLDTSKIYPAETSQWSYKDPHKYRMEASMKVWSADHDGAVIIGATRNRMEYECVGGRYLYLAYLQNDILDEIVRDVKNYGGWREYNKHAATRLIIKERVGTYTLPEDYQLRGEQIKSLNKEISSKDRVIEALKKENEALRKEVEEIKNKAR